MKFRIWKREEKRREDLIWRLWNSESTLATSEQWEIKRGQRTLWDDDDDDDAYPPFTPKIFESKSKYIAGNIWTSTYEFGLKPIIECYSFGSKSFTITFTSCSLHLQFSYSISIWTQNLYSYWGPISLRFSEPMSSLLLCFLFLLNGGARAILLSCKTWNLSYLSGWWGVSASTGHETEATGGTTRIAEQKKRDTRKLGNCNWILDAIMSFSNCWHMSKEMRRRWHWCQTSHCT